MVAIAAWPPPAGQGWTRGAVRRVGWWSGIALGLFALFFWDVHVGYNVSDPEIGTFTSQYSREQLIELSRIRAGQWRAAPPVELRRVSVEDHYLTEGGWHAQARNNAWTAGDVNTAWRENRILEKYYTPVLATPSFANPAGVAWPPEQRAAAAAQLVDNGSSFVSAAYPFPLYTWANR
jgi:hypothetical protein